MPDRPEGCDEVYAGGGGYAVRSSAEGRSLEPWKVRAKMPAVWLARDVATEDVRVSGDRHHNSSNCLTGNGVVVCGRRNGGCNGQSRRF